MRLQTVIALVIGIVCGAVAQAQLSNGGGYVGPVGQAGSMGPQGPAGPTGASGATAQAATLLTNSSGQATWNYPNPPCSASSPFTATLQGVPANSWYMVWQTGPATSSSVTFQVYGGSVALVSVLSLINLLQLSVSVNGISIGASCG